METLQSNWYSHYLRDSNGKVTYITVYMPELEYRIMNKYHDYRKTHYDYPTYLVLSDTPYCALRQWAHMQMYVSDAELESYNGMKVIHLKRYDTEIIEVG